MSEKEIRVHTADGDMLTFIAHPDGDGPFPVAVLFMDGVGYRDQIKDNARRFAAAGYYVVAPDLYHRIGDAISFDLYRMEEQRHKMLAAASSVTPEGATEDVEAVFAAIASDPAAATGQKVSVGYCMGASVALRMAAAMPDDFAAAAGIHPGALVRDTPDSPHHDVARVRGELYFAFAEIDRTATQENVEQFRQELARHRIRGTVERWPGVAHGFAMADLPMYDREATERHFERTLDLWHRNVKKS